MQLSRADFPCAPGLRCGAAAWVGVVLAVLSGCAATSRRAAGADADRPPPPPVRQLPDVSYDWHGLLAAPMGSALKEVPLALHEVLLFRDETRGGGGADDPECYALDSAAPRFIGHTPEEYLLCFKHDRLLRIQASVRLSADQAGETFTTACALWLKNAAPSTPATTTSPHAPPSPPLRPRAPPPTATPPPSPPPSAPSLPGRESPLCEGCDGAIHFSAQLAQDPGEANRLLSIILDGLPDGQ